MSPAHAARHTALIDTAPGGTGPGPLLATYFDLGYIVDGYTTTDGTVRLDNVSGEPACAFIYVFDSDQELQESCAVGLSANKDYSFYTSSLVGSPFFTGGFSNGAEGVIEIISGAPNTGDSIFSNPGSGSEAINCDPAAAITPVTAVNAWISTVTTVTYGGLPVYGATVLPFTDDGEPDSANLSTIQTALGVLGSAIGASGDGVCDPTLWPETTP
jgi:hypothetical protein